MARPRRRHLFIETDGQVYLVRDRGRLRFPRFGTRLPFRTAANGTMDFGEDIVYKVKPILGRHPEEWFMRDDLFDRPDVDDLVKRAIYATMNRCVSEVVVGKGSRVLMVKALRGYSKGHWNLPGGFMDYREGPEACARREAEEEVGVPVVLDGLLNVYMSGFPRKPSCTLGFVYRGEVASEDFHPKPDEIEQIAWFSVDRALTLTRNPFAKWGLIQFFLQSPEARRALRVHRHGLAERAARALRPTVFLDRDGVVNRGRPGYVRAPEDFELLPRAIEAMHALQEAGWRLVLVTNQDAMGWKLLSEAQLRRIHRAMLDELERSGVRLAEIYYCPHHILSDCACRKPRPGMLLAAARDLGVDPRAAWMVGDKVLDLQTGRAFGCRVAWVGPKAWRRRFEKEARPWSPDVVADDLRSAATVILRAEASKAPPGPPR